MTVDNLVSFVRSYNAAHDGKGCPRAVMIHVGGFNAKLIAAAHEGGTLVASVGGKGGSWPVGERPAASEDGPGTVKARMASALTIIANGGTIAPSDALAILADYEAQNAKRRKNGVDTDDAV